jgi:hypothetical protein
MTTRAAKVIKFIERHCLIPDGAQVGKPLVLADFQKQFIRDVYDNPAGTRRAYLSVLPQEWENWPDRRFTFSQPCRP